MGTCSKCRFWSDTSPFKGDEAEFHDCLRDDLLAIVTCEPANAFGDGPSGVATKAEFGCVQFETKI